MGSLGTIHNRHSSFIPLRTGSESKAVKHMKTSNRDALAPLIDVVGPRLSVPPGVTSTGIQKDRDKKQVNEPTGQLGIITSILGPPLVQQLCDARFAADFEVLPAAMWRNGVILVRAEVPLLERENIQLVFGRGLVARIPI